MNSGFKDVLSALFPDASDGLINLRALPSKAQDFVKPGDWDSVKAFASLNADQNLYFGVASRIEKDGTLSGSRQHCHLAHALWADIDFKDTPEAEARALVSLCPTPPSIIVHSGGGLHVYWLLKDGAPADDQLKSWLRRLARALKADLQAAEPARVLRLPDTLNLKYDPPRLATVEVFEPTRQYNLSDFTWLPDEPAKAAVADETQRRIVVHNLEKAAEIVAPFWPTNGVRHIFALALGGWLARLGLDPADTESLVRHAALQAGDEDEASSGDRSRAARDAADAVFSGDSNAYGYPKLVELAPDFAHVSNGVANLLGLREPVVSVSVQDIETGADDLVFPESAIIGLGRDFTDLYSAHFESPRAFWYNAFLTMLGACLSKKVCLASGLRTSPRMYTALLGTSGWTRKSSAMDETEDFFARIQQTYYGQLGPEELAQSGSLSIIHGSGSAEAIAKRLMREQHRPLLMKFDELKSLIDKGRQEGSQLMPLLTNTFEKGRWSNETLTYQVDLKDAAISLLSACTLKTFESAFKGQEADIGFLNRLWLVPGHLDKVIAVPQALPTQAVNELVVKVGYVVRQCVAVGNQALTMAHFAPDALELWRAWYQDFRQRTTTRESAARIDAYGLRLCILLAACEQTIVGNQLIISVSTVRAVIEMLEWQLLVRERYYPTVADNQVAAMEQRIRRVLARAPGQWFKRKDVYNLANGARVGSGVFDKAVDGLIRNNEVELQSEQHKYSKNAIRYYRLPAMNT